MPKYTDYKHQPLVVSWNNNKQDIKKYKISYLKYKQIISDLRSIIFNEIIKNPLGFSFPLNIGYMQLIGFKVKSWGKRMENIKVRTNGYYYRFCYYNSNYMKTKLLFSLYTFVLNRHSLQIMHDKIRNDEHFNWTIMSSFKTIRELGLNANKIYDDTK